MSKEDSNLEENATGGSPISLNPGMTLSGIGDPMLPTPTSVGSGDMLTVADIDDDEEEAKKDKTKRKLEMENLHLTFNKFINEDTVNEWGSSDQGYMNKSIHDDAGKPKKMPSPFDDKLRDAAEDAVDKYWDDWEEYDTDREGLIDNAVRGYLRSYFKKDFDLLTKMFEEEELLEAINPSKIEKSLNKQLGFQFFGEEDESIKLLKEPIRIESSYYGRSLKKAASNFKMSVVYVYGAFTNEYNEDLAVAGIISRTKDTTKVIMLTSEDWKAIYNGEAVVEYTGTDILSACQSKSKEIVNHLAKFPRDGSVYESIISEGKFEDGIADHQEIINDPKRTVYHLVDEIQFSTGDMTEKQWEMFMYGRYAKYRNDTDKKIKEKMYKVLTKWLAESIVTGFTEAKMTKDKLENLIYSLENQKDSWHPSSDSKKKAMLDKLKKDLSKFESIVAEKREDVGKYNTVKKVIAKLGRRPSEQDLATFINNNYYDVTEVERGDDDPSANDKIADLVGFYKFDIDDWDIAWVDTQNESIVTEEVVYNSSNTKPEAAKKATKEFGKLLPKANKDVKPYEFAVVKTKAKNYRLAIKSGSYVAHEFMTNLKDDGILTADIVKDAVANVIKLNPDEFNESVVNEEKIKYIKGKTYQSSGHWTVVVDSNSSGLDIRVNHSAGWRLSPHDEREETFELLDNGRKRATLNFKSGNIDKFGQEMFDLNDRTTNGNQTKLTAKDYADIIRVWIDMKMANESVNEAKNTIGLAFKEEQDYLDFKEFVAEQPRGAIRKNIGFDSKTKSWNVEMDVKVLDSIYGEGTPSDKKSGWYGGLPDDFESVIIESVVTEAAYANATRNELAQYIINLSNELVSAKSHNNKKEIKYLEKDIAEVKAALDKKKNESVVTEEENPCWDDYEVGDPKTKVSSKTGKRVNNCVPKNEEVKEVTEGNFEGVADLVKALHFELDPKTAEEMKIELGKRQGELVVRTQIEGGNYSLKRFRKEIKYGSDAKNIDLGVFVPGTYTAAVSTLGDGPHAKAAKKIKWNQKKYDQWLEDVASNDGWKNASDMAQNANNEPGLIAWVKKNNRGEDAMQRIQWDIEAFAESVVTEVEVKESHAPQLSRELNEASKRKVHKAAKQGSYPAVIVVVQDGKVIHQEPVSTPDVAPATFSVMQEKYPKAVLHLEDNTGKRLYSESVNKHIRNLSEFKV